MKGMVEVEECLESIPRQQSIKKGDYLDDGALPVIDQGAAHIGGFTDEVEKQYSGDLPVIVFGDHTRVLKWVDVPFVVGADGTQLLRPTREFLPRYFYYALRALDLSDYGYERHFKYLKKKRIRCRPHHEQESVASILSRHDDLIENCRQRRVLLHKIADELYKLWFVDFGFPGSEGVAQVDSRFGKIPENWEWTPVKDLTHRFPAGRKYKGKEVAQAGTVPVFSQSRDELVGFHQNEPDHEASLERPRLIFGDHTCTTHLLIEPFSVGPNVVPFEAKGEYSSYWLFHAVTGLVVQNEYKRHWSELSGRRVLTPPPSITRAYERLVQPLFQLALILRDEGAKARQIRDSVLPGLISGDIPATNAADEIGDG